MNRDFSALCPALVWKHFAAICNIPHPSHHEEKIRQYVVDFAEAQGLEYKVDEANNVYVRKPATAGMENRKGIVIQAHLDMVPQKNNDKVFDFENDPIEAYIDGEWVTANGTTLGADNGIGAAAILAVLEDKTLVHGEVEALFTATEETGMDGAFGLKGGHSGIQIGYQRANANRELFRLLNHTACDVRLASVDGGGLRNAIPREATAVVLVSEADAAAFEAEVAQAEKTLVAEFANIEDSISVKCTKCQMPTTVIPAQVAEKLAKAVIGAPNGVVKMSVEMEGLVQTSSNLARVVSDGSVVKIQCLLRSSVNSEKHALGEAIKGVFELAGATVELSGDYDGWKPNMESPILHTMLASYESLYGVKPAVMAIHAGLECGIIGGKYEGLDMISFGPTICFPHSPDEKVEIASVEKFYSFLLHTLANAPLK